MASERTRDAVYADLVNALLDLRSDPATERFDAEIAAALESGAIEAGTADVLTHWQRAALRGLADQVATVLPAVLGSLEAAQREAAQRAEQASDDEPVSDPAAQPAGSTSIAGVPTSLEEHRRRLIVASLTTVPPDVTLDLTRAASPGERKA